MADPTFAVHAVSLATADGLRLDGDLALPSAPWAAAVVAHPHPLYGGNRHSPVVDGVFRHLATAGVATVRFDFRGVGQSEGEHDGHGAERLDVAAALDLADDAISHSGTAEDRAAGPIVLVGYSFGARVALDVTDPRHGGWCSIAGPGLAGALAGPDHRPKLLLVPEHDQYTTPAVAAGATAAWVNTERRAIPMADHFLTGAVGRVADEVLAFVRSRAAR